MLTYVQTKNFETLRLWFSSNIKLENITTFNKCLVNCQTTIVNKIEPKKCKLCRRNNVAFTRSNGKLLSLSPLLIL